jgi:hypothetical protein
MEEQTDVAALVEGDALAALQTERDALAARVTELEGQWRDSVLTGALALALQQAGCRDVEAALALLDRGGVSLGEDGIAQGVADAVTALRGSRAYLFPPRTLGATNPAGGVPLDPAVAFATWLRGG